MLPETHPLIEAATKPLADNAEQRLAANALLEKNFVATHPGAADATARLEAVGRLKFARLRIALPWILAALALAAACFSHAPTFRFMAMMYNHNIFEPWDKPELPPGLTQEQRLLLGDPKLENIEQKKRLHHHDPENPAYFAEYAQVHVSQMSALPREFLETAASIAPENAYFPYFAAGQAGKESITKKRRSGTLPAPRFVDGVQLSTLPHESEFDINDPAAFEEALALFEKAAALPDFETYVNPMAAAKVRLFTPNTMAEFVGALIHAYGGSTGMIQLRYVSDMLCARSEQLSKNGSREEFLSLAAQRDAFIAHLARNPDSNLIGELVYAVIASATATNFHFAADRLGLTELAEKYRKQADAFREEKDLRNIRSKKQDDSLLYDKASSLTRLTLPMLGRQVVSPPPISETDFTPMRMAEHELLGGIGILSVALLILLAALALFLFRFVSTPMIRLPAKHMARVLGISDWLWVIGLGVASPIVFYITVTRFTPLGGREYGASHFLFLFPALPLVALLLGLLIAPAIVVRWRLSKRLAPFGLKCRFTVPLSLTVLAMIIVWSLVTLPFVVRFGLETKTLIAIAAPPALCLGLVFANALRSILGKPAARLAQTATAIAVLPVYPIAILTLCALTPIYSAGEKRWLAKETLTRIVPDAHDFGAYEYKVAAQKRRETNAILAVE